MISMGLPSPAVTLMQFPRSRMRTARPLRRAMTSSLTQRAPAASASVIATSCSTPPMTATTAFWRSCASWEAVMV